MSDASATDLPFSPAAERNQGPVLQRLVAVLPPHASVLEIASGTGQHAAHFAAARPDWRWQPSDGEASALPGIAARCAGLARVEAPLRLDVTAWPWPAALGRYDAVYCANLLHIAPWAACAGLMRGVQAHLRPGGCLVLYGPYVVEGVVTAPGNLAFDADLRARDSSWGLRDLADVEAQARHCELLPEQRHAMPANNLLLVFRKAAEGAG